MTEEDYMWRGREEDVEKQRGCGNNNNNNKTTTEKQISQRMQKHKRGRDVRRIRKRVEH